MAGDGAGDLEVAANALRPDRVVEAGPQLPGALFLRLHPLLAHLLQHFGLGGAGHRPAHDRRHRGFRHQRQPGEMGIEPRRQRGRMLQPLGRLRSGIEMNQQIAIARHGVLLA
jgi:hypothetical protein